MERPLQHIRDEKGKLPFYAWPGGYPILYVAADGGEICPECANGEDFNRSDLDPDCPDDRQWTLECYFVHYEGAPVWCDSCGSMVESAYGDPEAEE